MSGFLRISMRGFHVAMIDVFNSKYHVFYSFYRIYHLYYHYSCPEVIDVARPIATYLSDIAHFLARSVIRRRL